MKNFLEILSKKLATEKLGIIKHTKNVIIAKQSKEVE